MTGGPPGQAFVPNVAPVRPQVPGGKPEWQLLPMGEKGTPIDQIPGNPVLPTTRALPFRERLAQALPPTNAQQVGLDGAQLTSIIQATEEHKAAMDRLNAQVQSLAPVINQNMNSDAGQIMNNRLIEWTDDYNRVASALEALNERVHGVRNTLLTANDRAAGAVSFREPVIRPTVVAGLLGQS
jgi:hypothetical protein